jgi:hypothetical protein
MNDDDFDQALIAAAFAAIARDGWRGFSVAAAAGDAGLDLARARSRFPTRLAFLMRFGTLADRAAMAGDASALTVQERLFDMIMRRLDVFQPHRAGLLALFAGLPADPAASLLLAMASLNSMGWLLRAAGVPAEGVIGLARRKGLLAVWLWTLRAWREDETEDLGRTMAALDTALARAAQVARSLPGGAA